jgi:uncharacterized oxidoreductase
MSRDLRGKRILVTGATGGIGGALLPLLRAAGAVPLAHGRDPARLAALAAEGYATYAADLAAPDGPAALARAVLADGPLDGVVNNAGIQALADFTSDEPDALLAAADRELSINLRAPVQLVARLLPALRARPGAFVLNITSGLALMPKASAPVYCATKAALRSLSTSLRWQLAPAGVDVVEALPPLVDTAMTAGRGSGKLTPERCAAEIVDGLRRGRAEVYVGKSALLVWLVRLAPALAARIMKGA